MPTIEELAKDVYHRYYGWGSDVLRRRGPKYSDECRRIQFYGLDACRFCSKNPKGCSGRFIRYTGSNELGISIPFRRRRIVQADLGLVTIETEEQTECRLQLLIKDEIERRLELVEEETVEPFFLCEQCGDEGVISEHFTNEIYTSAREDAEPASYTFCSEHCRDCGRDNCMYCEGCGRDLEDDCFHWDDIIQEHCCDLCYAEDTAKNGTPEVYLDEQHIPKWPDTFSSRYFEDRGFIPVNGYSIVSIRRSSIEWDKFIRLWTTLRERGLVAVFGERTTSSSIYISMLVKPMSKNARRKKKRYKKTG